MKSQIKNQDKEEKNNYNQLEWEKAYKTNTDNFLIYSNDKLKEENIVFIKKILIDKFNIKANNNEIEMMWSEWGELNKAMFKKININNSNEILNAVKYFINYYKKIINV